MTDCCPAMGLVRQHAVFSDNCRNTQCAKSRSVCTFAACWKNCIVSSTQQRQQTKIQLSFYSPKTTNQTNNLEQFALCQNTDLKSFLSFTHQYKHCVFSQTIQTWTHRTTVTNVNESAPDRSQVYGTQSVNVPHLLAEQKSLKAIYVIVGWNCGTHYSEAGIWWCFQMPKKRCGSTLDHILIYLYRCIFFDSFICKIAVLEQYRHTQMSACGIGADLSPVGWSVHQVTQTTQQIWQ